MRYPNDLFLIYQVCKFCDPKTVIEIGFFKGLSLGLMIDACSSSTRFTSVDINFDHDIEFRQVFSKDLNRITWINQDSKSIDLQDHFDLALIDGNHRYDSVTNDLQKILPCLDSDSILIIDDYNWSGQNENDRGVKGMINDCLLGQHNWVPFLMGDQTMFFRHTSKHLDNFLDVDIQNPAANFMNFYNVDYHGYTVLKCNMIQAFTDNVDIYCLTASRYGL